MAVYYFGELISGTPKASPIKTKLYEIGTRIIFPKFTESSDILTVSFA